MDSWTIVTGASSGIGADFARIAAKEKRNVVISARRKDRLDAIAEELKSLGAPHVETVVADLAKPGAADEVWNAAIAKGRVDILVNNAGLGSHDAFAVSDWEREHMMLEVNITALTRLMKLAVPHMLEAGSGKIINVASIASYFPGPNMAAYHATKAYVLSLSDAVHEELQGTKVTITSLCPGVTQSEFFESADMGAVPMIAKGGLPTSMSVARAGWSGAKAGQRVVVPGATNWILTQLPRVMPKPWMMRMIKSALSKPA
ncbi:MAG: SDR family oxidoreductase [Pseudomonadota bacterium]